MCFNDFKNQNVSVLWLKWTQTMKMKQNQTFFHGTYSNLVSCIFLWKNIKEFQWLSDSKFLRLMTERNSSNRNQKRMRHFSLRHGQIWRHTFSHYMKKVFQWLSKSKFLSFMTEGNPNNKKWNKIWHFFMRHIQTWRHLSLVTKY